MADWKRVDDWVRRGRSFSVEVTRRDSFEGKNSWCVYAYVGEAHPLFAEMQVGAPEISHSSVSDAPLHGGCTYFHRVVDDGGQIPGKHAYVKFGADYAHLYDDHYAKYATPEAAEAVFRDADRLFAWLSEKSEAAE